MGLPLVGCIQGVRKQSFISAISDLLLDTHGHPTMYGVLMKTASLLTFKR